MKKFLKIMCLCICLVCFDGCFKKDNLENITIYTTVYPTEYITNRLYQNHSTIKSIYPDNEDITTYELTDKLLKDYSKGNMYIFNGLSKEKDYLIDMFNYNKNLMIIDATQSIEVNYNQNELWLDPSNFLMVASNIKTGLLEYIENRYLKEEIETNYDKLKIEISNLDAYLNKMKSNGKYDTFVVDDNSLNFLEKYGFTVISIENTENLTQKVKNEVYDLIEKKEVSYIYTLDKENLNDIVREIEVNTNVEVIELHKLDNLTDKQRSNGEDYISLLNDNITKLKNEIYK